MNETTQETTVPQPDTTPPAEPDPNEPQPDNGEEGEKYEGGDIPPAPPDGEE